MNKADKVLKKVIEYLQDEVDTYYDNPIDKGIESEEQGIFTGRAELAEVLLDQIRTWEAL
jgi:hypothetical protein